MAGINIRELFFKVTTRPEILPGDLRSALMEAGIAVARASNLLKGEVFVTLKPGISSLRIPTPPYQDLNRVDVVWYRDPADSRGLWIKLEELAPIFIETQRQHVATTEEGAPRAWGLRGDTLFLQAPSDGTYPLRITYSWSPTRASRPEVFDFPPDADAAMVAYARALLLKDLDPKAAEAAKREYKSELCDLRGAGESGESGVRTVSDFLPSEG